MVKKLTPKISDTFSLILKKQQEKQIIVVRKEGIFGEPTAFNGAPIEKDKLDRMSKPRPTIKSE